ncbi:hypothetical protein FRC09_016762, partial [Ceratobasidium sp. 395]
MSAPAARPMGPRRALPTPPNRQPPPNRETDHPSGPLLDPPPEMMAALGPPPSALSPQPQPPSFHPGAFLGPNGAFGGQGPSATPIPTPQPSPGFMPFQAPPPPPPLPGRAPASGRGTPGSEDSVGGPTPSEMMRSSRMGLYNNAGSNRPQLSLRGSSPAPAPAPASAPSPPRLATSTAPLKLRPKPRVEVPSTFTPSDLDSADADDERITRTSRPRHSQHGSFERSNLGPGGGGGSGGSVNGPSPGPMVGRIGGPGAGAGRPKLGLRTASGSALPDDDAPAPPPQPPQLQVQAPSVDPGAPLTSLRPKLQLHAASTGNVGPARPKLGLALPGSGSQGGGDGAAKPGLKLDLSAMRGADSEDDVDYSYYGKPTVNRNNSLTLGAGSESFPSDSSAATLRPPSMTTAMPGGMNTAHHPGRAGDGLDEVRRAINELRMPSSQTYDESTEAEENETGAEDSSGHQHGRQRSESEEERQEWSDEMFELIRRLGEGAGGAVNTVRDKRSGKIMARK